MAITADFTYGLVSRERIAAMTGKQILQAIIAGELPQAPISEALTFWIVEVGDGFAAFEGEPGPHLFNPMGTVHGGWALTLIDSVAGCAGHSLLPVGVGYATIETKGNFSRPITKATGRVRAEGRVVGRGRQILSSEARVWEPVAAYSPTVFRRSWSWRRRTRNRDWPTDCGAIYRNGGLRR